MDMVMPVMDGLTATEKIHRLPELGRVPVVVISASASSQDKEQALAIGAVAFIAKPIDVDVLLQEIGSLLKLSWQYQAQNQAPNPDMTTREPLPPEWLRKLEQLALSGKLRELGEQATQLSEAYPKCRWLTDELKRMAQELKANAVLKLIEAQLNGEDRS